MAGSSQLANLHMVRLLLLAMAVQTGAVTASLPDGYLTTQGEVLRLIDRNGDGDWLDAAEVVTHATGLPSGITAIVASGEDLFVLDPQSAMIYLLHDLNGDGDALDVGEAVVYSQAPAAMPASVLRGLAVLDGPRLYSLDVARGQVLLFEDLNHDGDGLDFGEARVVAEELFDAVSFSGRPDQTVLVARQSAAVGVSILMDRNADGDYLDYAENLSYVEKNGACHAVAAVTPRIAFVIRSTDSAILKLDDLTGDEDALDFGEVSMFATPITGALALSAVSPSDVYVAAMIASGVIHRLWDATQDGDALDAGEVLLVAENLTTPRGIYVRPAATTCLAGDVNEDAAVTILDVAPFADALLQNSPSVSLCRVDMNGDGQLDGRDIIGLIRAIVP